MGYSFRLTARVLLYPQSHRQDSRYHGFCYTSRGALVGTRNRSMGPSHEGSIRRPIAPWENTMTCIYIYIFIYLFIYLFIYFGPVTPTVIHSTITAVCIFFYWLHLRNIAASVFLTLEKYIINIYEIQMLTCSKDVTCIHYT